MARTRLYRNGVLEAEDFPVETIAERLSDDEAVVWLDLCKPTQADFDLISEELGLHHLAVEDAMKFGQRPKLDRYRDHLFISAYAVQLDGRLGRLTTSEIGVFATPRVVVTVRRDDRFDLEEVVARWDDNADLAKYGVAFLLHGLLDTLVDGHMAAVEELDQSLESVEGMLFDGGRTSAHAVQRRSFQLRRSLVMLRRVALPMREVVNALMRPTLHVVGEPMLPYYQDVYDHVLRASEWTESLRDLVTTILETNLTVQGNRMNLIMKQLTGWAAIIAVPTAVTGFYGQNVPYPGFGKWWGFVASITVTVVMSVALYITFKRKDWL
ncbi:magnesium transporter CorA family protein [Planosporangium flavigriseum]|uniref:Magnesium transporter CorA n=1 Tax=Planosporangium flavigriseum TaxID=373681 RepID=A0A8J3LRW7_9ACTN|nr:magnesium transporter CorA family protein [Planosporangium flavigriseum]NJC63257.1 magnesium transporter CorA family protein [Planosporangium flavigriseum]GIG72531.1 magnesium transporter CorA [Planosporangium flavigriseum]